MAAINFPDAPTNGQIFESGGMSWTYVAGIGWTLNSAIVEAGSGFTFIADTMPLPVNVGDTWFDSSTGASGGTSWVAVEEGPAGASEKVWVQFAPGIGGQPYVPPAGTRLWANSYFEKTDGYSTGYNDVVYTDGAGTLPYLTVATIDITGLYLKPDKQTSAIQAYIYATAYYGPDGAPNGVIYDQTSLLPSAGNGWTPMKALRGTQRIAANAAAPTFVIRMFTHADWTSGFSWTYTATLERFKL